MATESQAPDTISAFVHNRGLKKARTWYSKPVFVEKYTELEITFEADRDFEITFVWTIDGQNCPLSTKVSCGKGDYHVESLKVRSLYVSVQLQNLAHPATNNKLTFRVTGIRRGGKRRSVTFAHPPAASPTDLAGTADMSPNQIDSAPASEEQLSEWQMDTDTDHSDMSASLSRYGSDISEKAPTPPSHIVATSAVPAGDGGRRDNVAVSKKGRFKSPFRRKGKAPPSDIAPEKGKRRSIAPFSRHGSDISEKDRAPGYIPKEALLLGSDANTIKALPKGRDGEVLTVHQGCVCWGEGPRALPPGGDIGDIPYISSEGVCWISFRDAISAHMRLALDDARRNRE